jgi:glutamate racemase
VKLGVFDSGVGGLTVVRAIRRAAGNVSIRYLGDTARLPYGTKSPRTVVRYAIACVDRLLAEGPLDGVIVACNTASSCALPALREHLGPSPPVSGVIEPGARVAAERSRSGRIGVIATAGTVRSGCYEAAIRSILSDATVVARATPLLVPLAEEGYTEGAVVSAVLDDHLAPMLDHEIDTLVLGCTHYPVLQAAIEGWFAAHGRPVAIVDSASAVAREVASELGPGAAGSGGSLEVQVTDDAERFVEVATRFLEEPISLELVDLGQV